MVDSAFHERGSQSPPQVGWPSTKQWARQESAANFVLNMRDESTGRTMLVLKERQGQLEPNVPLRVRMRECTTTIRPAGNVILRADVKRHVGEVQGIFLVKENECPMRERLQGIG